MMARTMDLDKERLIRDIADGTLKPTWRCQPNCEPRSPES